MKKNIITLIFALLLIVSAACEQEPEKVVSKEPEVVITRIPERIKPAETRLSPGKTMEEDQILTKGNSQKELQPRTETHNQQGTDSPKEAQLRKNFPILKATQTLNDAKALKEKQEARNVRITELQGPKNLKEKQEARNRLLKKEPLKKESARSSLNQAAEYQEDFKDKPGKDSNVKIEKDSKAKSGKSSEKKISKDIKEGVREKFKDEPPLKDAAESLEDTKDGSKEKDEKTYISKGKIDPFCPLIKTEKHVKERKTEFSKEKEPMRILTPLEKLDFSQMKLVAIVHAESGNIAMVQESGGKGYIVKIGTFIGKNSGRIIKIQKDRIVIQERVKNFKGNFVERYQEMKLHKQEYEG